MFGGIGHSISNAFHGATNAVKSPLGLVSNPLASTLGAATSAVGNVGNAVKTTLSPAAYKNPSDVGKAWSNVGQAVGSPVTGAINAIPGGQAASGFVQSHGSELSSLASPALAAVNLANAARQSMVASPKRAQENADTAETNAANDLENEQNSLINQVRGQFGSTGVGQQRTNLMNAQRQAAQNQANIGFGSGLTQQRINAARSGQLGGSTDQTANGGLLANYYNTLAQGAVGAANAGQNFDQNLQQQRIATENAIRGSNVNDLSGMRGDLASLMNASGRGQMTQNALGSALPGLASTGSNLAMMQAFGAT